MLVKSAKHSGSVARCVLHTGAYDTDFGQRRVGNALLATDGFSHWLHNGHGLKQVSPSHSKCEIGSAVDARILDNGIYTYMGTLYNQPSSTARLCITLAP